MANIFEPTKSFMTPVTSEFPAYVVVGNNLVKRGRVIASRKVILPTGPIEQIQVRFVDAWPVEEIGWWPASMVFTSPLYAFNASTNDASF